MLISLEQVDSFIYLGETSAENNNEIDEVRKPIMLANKIYCLVLLILKNKSVHRKERQRYTRHSFGQL